MDKVDGAVLLSPTLSPVDSSSSQVVHVHVFWSVFGLRSEGLAGFTYLTFKLKTFRQNT